VELRLYLMRKAVSLAPSKVVLRVAGTPVTNRSNVISGVSPQILQAMNAFGDDNGVRRLMWEVESNNAAYAVFFPRGLITPGLEKKQTQVRRRFMLLGQTLDGMRVWDIRQAIRGLRSLDGLDQTLLQMDAEGAVGVDALYASLFEPGINGLDLRGIPSSHMDGPDYLNVLKYLDIPEAATMAAERCSLRLQPRTPDGWDFLNAMAKSGAADLKLEMTR
jgi:hypothetical protein